MKISRAAWTRAGVGLVLVLVANLLVLGLLLNDVLSFQQTFFTNRLMRESANRAIFGSIVIAAMDDKSLLAYGRLESWDRAHYAELIKRLKDAGAAAVAFRVPFTDADKHDDQVAAAIRYAMHPPDGSDPMNVVIAVAGDGLPKRVRQKGLEYKAAQAISPLIADSGAALADTTFDSDGTEIRAMPMATYIGGRRYFAFPLVAVNAAFNNPPLEQTLKFGDRQVQYGRYVIPTDQYYRMPINFFGTPLRYPSFSFVDIAQGRVNPAALKDHLVLVGPYRSTGQADDYPVPTSLNEKMDGVEIWANASQDLLLGKFITPQSPASSFLTMLGLSLLAAIVFLRWGAFGWLATLVLGAGFTLVSYVLTAGAFIRPPTPAQEQLITIPHFAYVDVGLVLSSTVLFVYLFVNEQRRRGAIYEVFGRYVTPAVAQQLASMQSSGTLRLGGSRREATIMFAELRGFQTKAIDADPRQILGLLNRYFEQAVKIIIDNGGTINKFIGADVMVMFNVPLDLPEHAAAACRAAYAAQQWAREYRASQGETAAFSVGINTGTLVAGNMGSQDRMEYTVIGDTVNVASRLNSVAAPDEIVISQATLDRLDGSGAKVVDKGEIMVKGRHEPVHAYQLIGFGDPGPVQVLSAEHLESASR